VGLRKNGACVTKVRITEQLKTYIRNKTAVIDEEMLCSVMKNITNRIQESTAPEGAHLLHSTAYRQNSKVHLTYTFIYISTKLTSFSVNKLFTINCTRQI
jgi:thiamine phosphate synthase YjbQ (UPF0047 family)